GFFVFTESNYFVWLLVKTASPDCMPSFCAPAVEQAATSRVRAARVSTFFMAFISYRYSADNGGIVGNSQQKSRGCSRWRSGYPAFAQTEVSVQHRRQSFQLVCQSEGRVEDQQPAAV